MNKYLIFSIIGLIIVLVIYWLTTKSSLESSKEKLTEEQIDTMTPKLNPTVIKPSKVKVMNFNTSWCKYSVMFAPEWAKFQSLVEDKPEVEVIDVKCDDPKNEQICDNYQVPGFPTVLFEYNNHLEEYSGERSAEAILERLLQILKEN